jgi:hypothetical protein
MVMNFKPSQDELFRHACRMLGKTVEDLESELSNPGFLRQRCIQDAHSKNLDARGAVRMIFDAGVYDDEFDEDLWHFLDSLADPVWSVPTFGAPDPRVRTPDPPSILVSKTSEPMISSTKPVKSAWYVPAYQGLLHRYLGSAGPASLQEIYTALSPMESSLTFSRTKNTVRALVSEGALQKLGRTRGTRYALLPGPRGN